MSDDNLYMVLLPLVIAAVSAVLVGALTRYGWWKAAVGIVVVAGGGGLLAWFKTETTGGYDGIGWMFLGIFSGIVAVGSLIGLGVGDMMRGQPGQEK